MADTIVPYQELLEPPVKRAAYSDRTAWIMSTMAQLAYLPFEAASSVDAAIADVLKLITGKDDPTDQDKARRLSGNFRRIDLEKILKNVAGAEARVDNLEDLKGFLAQLDFELVKTFSVHIPLIADTQAFLTRMTAVDRAPMLVLAFRGTEPKKPTDIKTDLKAKPIVLGNLGGPGGSIFVKPGEVNETHRTWPKVKVHPGFWQAFEAVRQPLTKILDEPEYRDLPLYITGHSLGGALAVVATYVLEDDRIAACYTFGGPRVGNLQFGQRIKPPVYRVVNASDIVARVPPGVIIDVTTVILRAIPMIPYLDKIADFLERFRGYRHYGDMRHLSAAESAFDSENGATTFPNLIVRSNPAQISRWYWLLRRWIATWGRAAIGDHSIEVYAQKLAFWAKVRSRK